MNPYISELFDLIDSCREEIKKYPWDFNYIGLMKQEINKNILEIKKISNSISPQIPEPWASMSAQEIIKGLGVYK